MLFQWKGFSQSRGLILLHFTQTLHAKSQQVGNFRMGMSVWSITTPIRSSSREYLTMYTVVKSRLTLAEFVTHFPIRVCNLSLFKPMTIQPSRTQAILYSSTVFWNAITHADTVALKRITAQSAGPMMRQFSWWGKIPIQHARRNATTVGPQMVIWTLRVNSACRATLRA